MLRKPCLCAFALFLSARRFVLYYTSPVYGISTRGADLYAEGFGVSHLSQITGSSGSHDFTCLTRNLIARLIVFYLLPPPPSPPPLYPYTLNKLKPQTLRLATSRPLKPPPWPRSWTTAAPPAPAWRPSSPWAASGCTICPFGRTCMGRRKGRLRRSQRSEGKVACYGGRGRGEGYL